MEFVFWYLVVGVFGTAIHNVAFYSMLDEWQRAVTKFDLVGLLIQIVIWPILIVYWIGRFLNR